jgi:hypothetical protein
MVKAQAYSVREGKKKEEMRGVGGGYNAQAAGRTQGSRKGDGARNRIWQ